MSNGTICNFMDKLSNESSYIISGIKENILNATLMHTDATTARCENKNVSVRNYSTEKYTLLIGSKGKSKKDIEDMGILERYTGKLVHDHETLMYRYGSSHGECNVHISRYLKGSNENTENRWSSNMRSFLCSLNRYKKEIISQGKNNISESKLTSYSSRYDEILEKGFIENALVRSKYKKVEEKRLLNRLSKYKNNHLLFIYDFEVPFDNNLSERDLRHVKSKQKVSGYFKSMKGLQNYLDIKSIIGTCKKQKIDFYNLISDVFKSTPVFL